MKEKILSMLLRQEEYISGQQMCEELGVTRTAVWKVINQLKEEGYAIEAVPNKGYVLRESPDSVAEYELKSQICKVSLIDTIVSYKEVDSTNNKAKELARNHEENMLIVADAQTTGRGSKGRNWSSPKGEGIWMSFLCHPSILPIHASRLTLIAALAVVKAIGEETGLKPQIKWPNDILLNNKKVCGILTEMSSELDYIHYVIVGIGINVHTKEFPQELIEKATSIALEGKSIKRSHLIRRIVEYFDIYVNRFLETEELSLFLEEYNNLLVHKNKKVQVLSANSTQEGIARGIDTTGSLLLELKDGSIKPVISGEVSVRGLQGYI